MGKAEEEQKEEEIRRKKPCWDFLSVALIYWYVSIYLSNRSGQEANDALVRYSNYALAVNFNDAVADTDAASFRNPSTQ